MLTYVYVCLCIYIYIQVYIYTNTRMLVCKHVQRCVVMYWCADSCMSSLGYLFVVALAILCVC